MGTNALPGLHRCPLFNDLYPTIYIQRSNEMPRDLMYPQGEYLGLLAPVWGAKRRNDCVEQSRVGLRRVRC